MEALPMRSSPVLVSMDSASPSSQASADEVLRTLLDLIEKNCSSDSNEARGSNSSEEVLVDTEIYGSRYLLVRMPKPSSSQIRLSPREHEIVRMVAKGHPNKVIADVLNISSWTVCTHLRRIFAKLGVGSRAAMVAQLLEIGVLASEHRGQTCAR
jgi:DNA-binding CsgD family transcriptional regulator